jgi:hypothetical protein
LAKSFDSDPCHEAGEGGEAALLGVRRDTRQLEDLVGNLGIKPWRGHRSPSVPSGLREPAPQCLEPGVHLVANRITNGNIG